MSLESQVTLEELANTSLRGPWPSDVPLKAGELWAQRPCVIYAMRRAGCPFCRRLTVQLMQRVTDFEAEGARLIIVVSEAHVSQAHALVSWRGGEVYIDEGDAFKRALGAGPVPRSVMINPAILVGAVNNAMRYGNSFADTASPGANLLGGEVKRAPPLFFLRMPGSPACP